MKKWFYSSVLVILVGGILFSIINSRNTFRTVSPSKEALSKQQSVNNDKTLLLANLNTKNNSSYKPPKVISKALLRNINTQRNNSIVKSRVINPVPNKQRFPNRKVILSEESELPNGNILRTSLVEVPDFKYKKIKILETINPSTDKIISSKEMVASHFLLKTHSNVLKEELQSHLSNTDLQVIDNLPLTNIYLVSSPTDTLNSLEQSIEIASKNKSITVIAEPDYIVHAISTIPNDSQYSQLYGMDLIEAPKAWDISTGSKNIVVGVIDTGVNYNHPDLSANMWHNEGEDWNGNSPGNNGIDDDGNGYIDDYYGIDAINGDSDPMDDNGHGSHCSGTIGGVGNNGEGVVGVNWNVSIMGMKFLSSEGGGVLSDGITCVNYATQMGADLTSNSWGGGGGSDLMLEAIRENGKLFIAASGNAGSDNDTIPSFPDGYETDNVISVAAVDSNDNLAGFSNYGKTKVDLAAPGVQILSSTLGSSYEKYDGTSMACPHVAGAAALLLSVKPYAEYGEIKQVLMDNVDVLPSLENRCITEGRLNIYKAITSIDTRPALIFNAPNVDTVFVINNNNEISWNSYNVTGNVKLELLHNNTFHSVLSANTEDDGSFIWNPGASLQHSNNYNIRITSLDDSSINKLSDSFILALNPPKIEFLTISNGQVIVQKYLSPIDINISSTDNGTIVSNSITVEDVVHNGTSLNWTPSKFGKFEIIASATDNDGEISTSKISITVEKQEEIVIVSSIRDDSIWWNFIDISITNKTKNVINEWNLEFEFDFEVGYFEHATIKSHTGNHYSLLPNNSEAHGISPGQTMKINGGFSLGGSSPSPELLPRAFIFNGTPVDDENYPPSAGDDIATVKSGEKVTVNVLSNDSDPNGDAITVTSVSSPSKGSASIVDCDTLCKIEYTSIEGQSGTDNFTYTIDDGNGGSATGNVTVQIELDPVNRPPMANNDSATLKAGESVTIKALSNDSDPDNDILTIISVTSPSKGTAVITNCETECEIIYSANAGTSGNDTFIYTVADGQGGTATGTVSVSITPADPVNNPPVAVSDSATVRPDESVVIYALSNDSDPDGDKLEIISLGDTIKGTAVVTGCDTECTIVYSANVDAEGSEIFEYTISDGNGGIETASVTVNFIRDEPGQYTEKIINNAFVGGGEAKLWNGDDDTWTLDLPFEFNFYGNIYSSVHVSSNGVLDFTNSTVGQEYDNHDEFLKRAVRISPLWDDLMTNSSDSDIFVHQPTSDSICIRWYGATWSNDGSVNPVNFEVVLSSDGRIEFNYGMGNSGLTPTVGISSGDSELFTISASHNNKENLTDAQSLLFTPYGFDSGNSDPVANNDSAETNQGETVTLKVLENDTGDKIELVSVTAPSNGRSFAFVDSVMYTPNANYIGNDSFTYTIKDANGNNAVAEVMISVKQLNDQNTVSFDIGNVTASFTVDPDEEPWYGIYHLSCEITGSEQGWDMTVNFPGSQEIIYSFGTAVLSDTGEINKISNYGNIGYGVFDLYIQGTPAQILPVSIDFNGFQPANNSPVAVNDTAMVNAGESITVNSLSNDSDPDGDDLEIIAVANPSKGLAVITSCDTECKVVYTANADAEGTDIFEYTLSDGKGGIDTAVITVQIVNEVNEAPIVSITSPVNNAVIEQASLSPVNIVINANDSDGNIASTLIEVDGQQFANIDTASWTPSGFGSFNIVARAVDNDGAQAFGMITVTIKEKINTGSTVVRGWPDYIAMGAVTRTMKSAHVGRPVNALFKYAGDGGNGDRGSIKYPIYTKHAVEISEELEAEYGMNVVPVMVIYTADMSGGTNFDDLHIYDNLVKHFVNLIHTAKVMQSFRSDSNPYPGSFVMNPDLIGMIQQNRLISQIEAQPILVQKALYKALHVINDKYEFKDEMLNTMEIFDKMNEDAWNDWGAIGPWVELVQNTILPNASEEPISGTPQFENNFKGWIQANNYIIKRFGQDITFGWQENLWSSGSSNWVHGEHTDEYIRDNVANTSIDLWNQLEINSGTYKPDFMVFDKYERDAIYGQWLFNDSDWDSYMSYVKHISTGLEDIPVMLWQIPGGHIQTENDVDLRTDHGSTAPNYFLGDPKLMPDLSNIKSYITDVAKQYLLKNAYDWSSSNQMQKAKESNVFSILWGGGDTTSVGNVPYDDGGWLSDRLNKYYENPTYLK